MNKLILLEKYKKLKQHDERYLLQDGGIVIGTEVDENNYLYYVVKQGTDLSIIRAEGIKPIANLVQNKRRSITVSFDPKSAGEA